MADHALRSQLEIDVHRIGETRAPVLVIDGVLDDAATLVQAAASATGWREGPATGYPGIRTGLPASYARNLLRRLDPAIRRELLPGPARLVRFDARFALVTRDPARLHPLQRLPHIDVADPWRIALVHFLCDASFGGTGFFRQSATGLEQVLPQDREGHVKARLTEVEQLPARSGYPGKDTPGYELIAGFAARFDRLLAYRAISLHSGLIDSPALLSPDPLRGRLTTTFFLDYAAQSRPAGEQPHSAQLPCGQQTAIP
ncbi:MAG TPA: DUF6445 family protein [Novosphingobium sp.]|nr:DUF6445 family protein [Novosphingobium sp.]HMP55427.1 DUF6445 family protein [Novosphingobium sp.]